MLFVPLGGSEQFGINLNAYMTGGDILVVDCGLGFADERYPGIDIILPDISALEESKEQIAGMIITHAHEDHIGAVAHLWPYLECPLYASEFTAEVLKKKFEERGVKKAKITVIDPHETVQIGAFPVQFIPVAHSIPDAVALAITTPKGVVLHSGDWNLDPRPVVGVKTDEKAFKALGKKGVLAYIGDSTNAQVDGYSGSEQDVISGMEEVFAKCKGRVVVTIFSSNISRMKTIAKTAQKFGRDVGVAGRSLHRMIGIAKHCGYLDDVPDLLSEQEIAYLPNDRVCIIATGSQGEYRSALAKIARDDHREITLDRGDTVIFSSREIPGNEKDINAIKNNLSAGGIHVVTPYDTEHTIHVSGHPCREEIAKMLGWVRPQMVIPIHGERAQLEAQARYAKSLQISQTLVPYNGAVIRLSEKGPEIIDEIPVNILALDQKRIIDVDHPSIIQRRKLQYTGMVHISAALDHKGRIQGALKLAHYGLLDEEDPLDQQILDRLHDEIDEILSDIDRQDLADEHFVSEELRIGVRRYFANVLGIKPRVSVHIFLV